MKDGIVVPRSTTKVQKMAEIEEVKISKGERLKHILDKANFAPGRARGRIKAFHEYLVDKDEFNSLKYSTVLSWFHEHAPPAKNIELIINILHEEYDFKCPPANIIKWWKHAGVCPFCEIDHGQGGISGTGMISKANQNQQLALLSLTEQAFIIAICWKAALKEKIDPANQDNAAAMGALYNRLAKFYNEYQEEGGTASDAHLNRVAESFLFLHGNKLL